MKMGPGPNEKSLRSLFIFSAENIVQDFDQDSQSKVLGNQSKNPMDFGRGGPKNHQTNPTDL